MKLEMISRSCPICKTEKYGELFAKENFDLNRLNEFGFASRKTPEYMHYKLVSCKNCDLLYASELPKDSFLEVAYHQAAFDSANEAKAGR